MREASFRKRMIAPISGVFALAGIFAPPAFAASHAHLGPILSSWACVSERIRFSSVVFPEPR